MGEKCDQSIAKEGSVKQRVGILFPSLEGNLGEKMFIDLVSMSETVQGYLYLLTVQYVFSCFSLAYPKPNKEASTLAGILVGEHFLVHGLPHQIHSDNGLEFVNFLWKELFSEFNILHTTTPAYNPSSNIIERFHRNLEDILRCMGEEIVHEWDLSVKSAILAYNTSVHSSTGVTLFYAMYGREAILPVDWV